MPHISKILKTETSCSDTAYSTCTHIHTRICEYVRKLLIKAKKGSRGYVSYDLHNATPILHRRDDARETRSVIHIVGLQHLKHDICNTELNKVG